jgi:DNA polymerase-3 subunit delta
MLHILAGADDLSRQRALAELKAGLGDPGDLAANTSVFDGGKVALAELIAACQTVPFLAANRLIVVTGLMPRFAARRKIGTGKKKGGKKAEAADELTPLTAVLTNLPPSTELVLLEDELKETNVLFKALKDVARVRPFPPIKDRDVPQWVRNRVEETGAAITPAAATLLARLVGRNLWVLASEVEKLTLYADGRCIEESDVSALTSAAREANIFELVDAVFDADHARAESRLESLLHGGESPTGIIVMLHRQLRLILLCQELTRLGVRDRALQQRLGLAWEFQMRRVQDQARRFSRPQLEDAYRKLMAADRAIKTGRYDGDLALNVLILEIGTRAPVY